MVPEFLVEKVLPHNEFVEVSGHLTSGVVKVGMKSSPNDKILEIVNIVIGANNQGFFTLLIKGCSPEDLSPNQTLKFFI